MKNHFLFLCLSSIILLSCSTSKQKNRQNEIKIIIEQFVENADSRNVPSLKQILNDNFRVIINRAFGSETLSIIDKNTYIDLLDKGIIGGDTRQITIQRIDIDQHNAVVKALFVGINAIFNSTLLLTQNYSGKWEILTDMPTIEAIEE